MTVTSASLATIASELGTLVENLGTVETTTSGAHRNTTDHLASAAAVWAGPRRDAIVTAATAYLDAFAPAPGAIAQARVLLTMIQVRASQMSETMSGYESTIELVRSARTAGGPASPELEDAAYRAENGIVEQTTEWQSTCLTSAGALDTMVTALRGGFDASPADFGIGAVSAHQHAQSVAVFATEAHLDVADLVFVPPVRSGQTPMSWWMSMTDLQRFAVTQHHPERVPVDNWTFDVGGRQVAYSAGDSPGVDLVAVPDGAESHSFDIPVWEGYGVTRIQLFIDDDLVCLPGGFEQACGQGDWRSFAGSDEYSGALTDYDVSSRAVIVLDHERGEAIVVAYPTHDMGADEIPALPFEEASRPIEESGYANFIHGGGSDDGSFLGVEYRLLNSSTPSFLAADAPAINGLIQVRPVEGTTQVEIQGLRADYPSIEMIRDIPAGDGYTSEAIFQYQRESGGPENLYEFPHSYDDVIG